MEIWIGQSHVPQSRYLEFVNIFLQLVLPCSAPGRGAAPCLLDGKNLFGQAHVFQRVATYCHAIMTTCTTNFLKQGHNLLASGLIASPSPFRNWSNGASGVINTLWFSARASVMFSAENPSVYVAVNNEVKSGSASSLSVISSNDSFPMMTGSVSINAD